MVDCGSSLEKKIQVDCQLGIEVTIMVKSLTSGHELGFGLPKTR